jgi:hypothetical protein
MFNIQRLSVDMEQQASLDRVYKGVFGSSISNYWLVQHLSEGDSGSFGC